MLILNDAPTVANCVKYAKAFGRGYGSIEQIYRWAAAPQKDIQGRRETDAFIEQIKRVSSAAGAQGLTPIRLEDTGMETSPEEIRFFDEKPQLIGLYAALRRAAGAGVS